MSNSEAPAVIAIHPDDAKNKGNPACDSMELDQYVRRDIFDAYREAADAWLDGTHNERALEQLMQAARRAGESVK